ncbi:hypothetical protein CLF_103711 [Clonorchis sinensis]|uniref:Uncharacterized protein n=1 Tax=Clonorchis sinensis TaxID=79923 RepID=H2KQD8_CLOSI|nr:hypothetical protein CLF_103711 [Clonorchis sinensis]
MVLFSAVYSPTRLRAADETSQPGQHHTALSAVTQAHQQPTDQTQPNTESTDIPKTVCCGDFSIDTGLQQPNCPAKPYSKMASMCFPFSSDPKECGGSFANPDVYTSAGLVANGYARFRTHFWIDRALVWLTVLIPVVEALGLIVLHAILGVARCVPRTMQDEADTRHMKDFFDRACGLQLTSNVLKGDVYQTSELSSNLSAVQLQHECYPFILLMVAVAMWLPHYLYHRAVDKTARRDLCLIRSELHSFRRAVGQELNYLQAMSTASMEGVPTTALFSPGSTIPQAQTLPATVVRHATHPGPPAFMQQGPNSGRTTAATVGGTSLLSQTPAPTVIPALQPQTATMVTNRGALLPPTAADPSPTAPALNYGDADFSAPGLLDLPCFHACHADWSLNTYLSAWQNTDFYWRRYLAKHVVLATFQVLTTAIIFLLIGLHKGALFTPLFHCKLGIHGNVVPAVCMLQTTFILNMSFLSWGCFALAGLSLQLAYFYSNFIRIFGTHSGRYFGVTSRPTTFITGLDETGRCFFADYIRLLAYTAFRDTQCEIRNLSVSYSPELYRSDFHFISLLCTENSHLLPDAIHIHFWTERYARLCRRRFRRPYWAMRRGSLGHLVRCEDLSMRFNFSKISVKVEVNDFGF